LFPLPSGIGPDPFWLGAGLGGGGVSLGLSRSMRPASAA
jgi:hypothetical protein